MTPEICIDTFYGQATGNSFHDSSGEVLPSMSTGLVFAHSLASLSLKGNPGQILSLNIKMMMPGEKSFTLIVDDERYMLLPDGKVHVVGVDRLVNSWLAYYTSKEGVEKSPLAGQLKITITDIRDAKATRTKWMRVVYCRPYLERNGITNVTENEDGTFRFGPMRFIANGNTPETVWPTTLLDSQMSGKLMPLDEIEILRKPSVFLPRGVEPEYMQCQYDYIAAVVDPSGQEDVMTYTSKTNLGKAATPFFFYDPEISSWFKYHPFCSMPREDLSPLVSSLRWMFPGKESHKLLGLEIASPWAKIGLYVDPRPYDVAFMFHNAMGFVERLTLHAAVEVVSEREFTILDTVEGWGHNTQAFNTSFKVTISSLTEQETLALRQLYLSEYIAVDFGRAPAGVDAGYTGAADNHGRITLKEFDIKQDDEYTPPEATITFYMFSEHAVGLPMPGRYTSLRIHSHEFNTTFS